MINAGEYIRRRARRLLDCLLRRETEERNGQGVVPPGTGVNHGHTETDATGLINPNYKGTKRIFYVILQVLYVFNLVYIYLDDVAAAPAAPAAPANANAAVPAVASEEAGEGGGGADAIETVREYEQRQRRRVRKTNKPHQAGSEHPRQEIPVQHQNERRKPLVSPSSSKTASIEISDEDMSDGKTESIYDMQPPPMNDSPALSEIDLEN